MKKTQVFLSLSLCLLATQLAHSMDIQRLDLVPRVWADTLIENSALPADASQSDDIESPFAENDIDVLFTQRSEQSGDGFGWVAEDLGDINDDGASDFIVTAPFFGTNLPFPAGKIYVISGADGKQLNSVTSPGIPVFGYSAKDAGDVDGDGVTDYIVGSFSSVMVFSGATHAILHLWYRPGEFFGASVAGAGDLNGDGFDDVIVGATYAGERMPFRGRIYAYSGQTGQRLWTRPGRRAGDELGTATGPVGDVNHDGVPDVVVGARGAGRNDEGRAYILSGHNGRILHTLRPVGEPGLITDGAGITAGTFAQFHAFGVGDIDGDAVPDVYVGDYNARQDGVDGSGKGYLFSGASGDRLHIFKPENLGDGLGPARGVGDVDNDGLADLYIAAYTFTGGSNAGKAYLYSGADKRLLRTMTGTVNSAFLGVDALGLGDVNADGLRDYLLTGNGVLHVIAGN